MITELQELIFHYLRSKGGELTSIDAGPLVVRGTIIQDKPFSVEQLIGIGDEHFSPKTTVDTLYFNNQFAKETPNNEYTLKLTLEAGEEAGKAKYSFELSIDQVFTRLASGKLSLISMEQWGSKGVLNGAN